MKLYHGTTREGYEGIIEGGMIYGPVYFSPRKDVAANYAMDNDCDGAVVICIEVDESLLNIDNESYDGTDLDEALAEGVSVYVTDDIEITGAKFDYIGYDYENN